jgi:hypothetical protein
MKTQTKSYTPQGDVFLGKEKVGAKIYFLIKD